MKFPPQFLDTLRQRVVLSDFISQNVRLTKKGREHEGLCPFHKEKSPSFTVNNEKFFFHCFGCGAHGDAINFAIDFYHLTFAEAVEKVALYVGLPLPQGGMESISQRTAYAALYQVMEESCAWYIKQLHTHRGFAALEYVRSRGLAPHTVEKFRLGFAPEKGTDTLGAYLQGRGYSNDLLHQAGLLNEATGHDRFWGRLIFPITDTQERVIAFGGRTLGVGQPKYLNSPDTPLFNKGEILYGLAAAKKAVKDPEPVMVVEGYMDVIALIQAGLKKVVAPLGTALTESQLSLLWRVSPEPLLCFDGDDAGKRAADRAAMRALPLLKPGFSMNFLSLPQGEDPDSVIRRGGKALWDQLSQHPRSLIDVLWSETLAGQRLDTPERRALIQQQLAQKVQVIQDPGVRSEYQRDFKNRWYGHIRRKNKDSSLAIEFLGVKTPNNPKKVQQRILLGTLLVFPGVIEAVDEAFAMLSFSLPEYESLKQAIISALGNDKVLDNSQLSSHLREEGHEETLRDVLQPDIYMHASFLKPGSLLEDVLKGWYEVFQRYQESADLLGDALQIQQRFKEDMSVERWEKLKAFKSVMLLNGHQADHEV